MTDLQVFESSNLVSSGWALGQAKHSRSRERVLLGHWRRPPFSCQVLSMMLPLGTESGHWHPGRGLAGAGSNLCNLQAGMGRSPGPWLLALVCFKLLLCLACVFSVERVFLSCPRQVRMPSLIRRSVLILVRTIYLRLLPGFANCFPFSREPKEKNGIARQRFENWSGHPPTPK